MVRVSIEVWDVSRSAAGIIAGEVACAIEAAATIAGKVPEGWTASTKMTLAGVGVVRASVRGTDIGR